MRRIPPWLCVVLLVLAAGTTLTAHALSVSYATYAIHDRDIQIVVRLPMDDMDLLLRLDRDLDGKVSAAEIGAARALLQTYILKHLTIRVGEVAPDVAISGLGSWRDDKAFEYLEVQLACTTPVPITVVTIQSSLLVDLYSQHRTLGEISAAGRSEQFVFEPGGTYERTVGTTSLWKTTASFLWLGIRHIFTGYDHILFLFGLLLVGRGIRNLVAVVSSFTVAHSITLALAVLGILQPAPWTTEVAIALSISYIGIENLLVGDLRHRWTISFVFGLVHGFGFAAILQDMHLPRAGIVVSLFSFNAGVEIGQIAIVSLMYPLLALLARTPRRPLIVRVASVVITAVGLLWCYQRLP